MVKKILMALVGLVAVLVVVGLILPASTHVERETTIAASPEQVFGMVNDFQNFNRWSPWAERDPKTKYTFEGPSSGVGAKMSWASDHPNVGSGSQEIIESKPHTLVRTALDFGDQGQAVAFFKIEPAGEGTKVTWGFDTDAGYNLIGRYFGLILDGMLGPDYERGLANLKRVTESQPAPAAGEASEDDAGSEAGGEEADAEGSEAGGEEAAPTDSEAGGEEAASTDEG